MARVIPAWWTGAQHPLFYWLCQTSHNVQQRKSICAGCVNASQLPLQLLHASRLLRQWLQSYLQLLHCDNLTACNNGTGRQRGNSLGLHRCVFQRKLNGQTHLL